MSEYHCNYSSNSFWPVLVLWGRKYDLVRRSYIIVGSKLCSNVVIILVDSIYQEQFFNSQILEDKSS